MNQQQPAFLITVDTEGDNLWNAPATVATENAAYIPRFQDLCEKYGFKPTYLTNYEMATDDRFYEFAADQLKRQTAEIGMHLHAWDSPPLSENGPQGQAYLIEFPESVMREKIRFMTDLLEQRFQKKMTSHRAGRWGFDHRYARLLAEAGYLVDCSVTPFISWRKDLGDPNGNGGPDYTKFQRDPYFLDLDHIDRPGNSTLLEIPVSVIVLHHPKLFHFVKYWPYLLRRMEWNYFPKKWLYPDGSNLYSMQLIIRTALDEHWPCVEFAIHSSELMPGGSPTFQTEADIDALYNDLETVFSEAKKHFRGATLTEFYNDWRSM